MGDVQFEEFGGSSTVSGGDHRGLVGLLFKYNIVSTEAQAQKVLIGLLVVVLLLTAYVLFSTGSSAPTPVPIDATMGIPGPGGMAPPVIPNR